MSGRSLSGGWSGRKSRLQTLLDCCGDDEEQGIALDQVICKATKNVDKKTRDAIEAARFSDKDVSSFGPLAEAQFGTVELVSCKLDGRVYVRKRISKKFALKTRDQCSPFTERQILLLALNSRLASSCTPRMLCAYQCPDHLNIVMEYAQGGSLWDILESSSAGRLSAADLSWWAPQCVSALAWLHERANFAHRDVKPHNFVVRLEEGKAPRLLLIDFGSAAALEDKDAEGVQRIAREACLVPCGTCDYISPEILKAHEEALVALEMSDDEFEVAEREDESDIELRDSRSKGGKGGRVLKDGLGYGRETDWWSLGAMLYELAFGFAPFFASDIRQTYTRIMNHESNLSFDRKLLVPPALANFIKGCLTHHETRLGRHSDDDVKKHPYFRGISWNDLSFRTPPPDLLLPQFSFEAPLAPSPANDQDLSSDSNSSGSKSRPFAFSQLFQSSTADFMTPSRSFANSHLTTPAFARRSLSRSQAALHDGLSAFVGFSWGPPKDAFEDATRNVPAESGLAQGLPKTHSLFSFNEPSFNPQSLANSTMKNPSQPFITPMRPSHSRGSGTVPPSTIRVTASAKRRAPGSGSATRAGISDRDAMRMLVDCVGMSARKKVLESGKKPRVLIADNGFNPPPPQLAMDFSGRDRSNGDRDGEATPTVTITGTTRSFGLGRTANGSAVKGDVRKELRFDDTTTMHFAPPVFDASQTTNTFTNSFSRSLSSHSRSTSLNSAAGFSASLLPTSTPHPPRSTTNGNPAGDGAETETDGGVVTETETGSECPPSPSPSPRPGSAMSMLSINRTRSGTPTASYLFSSSLAREKSASASVIGMGFPGGGEGADRRMMRRTASSASMSGQGFGNGNGSLGLGKITTSPQAKKLNGGEARRPKVGFIDEDSEADVDFDVGKTPMKGREKRKVVSTPHPLARAKSAPEPKTPGRKARFDVDPTLEEESEGEHGGMNPSPKPTSTPYPRGKGRARFDVDSSHDEERVRAAKKLVSTPHPRSSGAVQLERSEGDSLGGRDNTEDMRRAFEEALQTPKSTRNLICERAKAKGTPHPFAKIDANSTKPFATPARRRATVEDDKGSAEEMYTFDNFEDDGDTIRPARQASPVYQDETDIRNESAIPTSTKAVLGTPIAESTINDDKDKTSGIEDQELRLGDSVDSDTGSVRLQAHRGSCEDPERGLKSRGNDRHEWEWAGRIARRLPKPKTNTNTDADEGAHFGRGADSPPAYNAHMEQERSYRSPGTQSRSMVDSTFNSPGAVSRLSEYRSVDTGKREGEEGRWEEMERRYARLRADIANVSAHLEEFVRWTGAPPRVKG